MEEITTVKEKQQALKILVDAYFEAANVTWLLKTKSKEKLHAIFNLLFHDAQAKNGAFLSKNKVCVLFLYEQKAKNFSILQILRKLHVFLFVTGISNGIKALKFQKLVATIRPKEGLLGMALGVEENQITTATIYEIKRTVFELSKAKNLPIYAETTVPRLLKLYKIVGFELYHEMKHPYADLEVWFLKREVTNSIDFSE